MSGRSRASSRTSRPRSKPSQRHSLPRPPRRATIRLVKKLFLPCAISAFVGMALVASLSLGLSKKPSPYHKLNLFTRVLSYVENNYVENIDQDELIYGALRGMLETLDPHT